MRNIFRLLFVVLVSFFFGCETFDLDQTENPSTLPQSASDPIYVFNSVQVTLPDFVDSANDFTQRVTRQLAMTGGSTYVSAFSPELFDNNWTTGYLLLNSIKSLEPKALENQQFFILGASKVIRCYVLMTMVDMYGNIPYSESLQGNANLTPKYDSSSSVYAGIYNELNEAINYLNNPNDTSNPNLLARDLYYGTGNEGIPANQKWVTLANTLKLKMLNNARNVGTIGTFNVANEVNLLLAENNLIDSPDEDFQFNYGNERFVPNSRHPMYNEQYELNTGSYLGNYFMWAVTREKAVTSGSTTTYIPDPRERFYFFKKSGSLSEITSGTNQPQILPCASSGSIPQHYLDDKYASFYNPSILATYCTSFNTSNDAYLGRDHGDASGIPADAPYRTVVGLYPIGGEFGQPVDVNGFANFGETGELGRGIMPILLSSYVNFIKAELKLELSITNGLSVKQELENGILASINKTTSFIPMPEDASNVINDDDFSLLKSNYVNYVLNFFDTLNDEKKLELIIKEYYIASWGNGVEPYNSYRRTGYPSNFQPTIEENSGSFFNTALYPAASVNNNPNAPQNIRTKKVFWDVMNFNLH